MKTAILFLFTVFSFCLSAQNLIPNPGFEDVNICEVYQEQCSPKAWRNVLLKGFRFPEAAMLINTRRGIMPKEGLRAAVLPLFHKTRRDDRIFIQSPFLCALEKDSIYIFSFYYLLTEETTQSFGIVMLDSLVIRDNIDHLIGQKPDMEVALNQNLKYKEWQKYEVEYTANGGEQGIMIGNFMPDEEIEYTPLKKLRKNGRYPKRLVIWLDDFNFSPKGEINPDCDLEEYQKRIYADSVRHYKKHILVEKDIRKQILESRIVVKTKPVAEEEVEIVEEEITEVIVPEIKEVEEEPSLANNVTEDRPFVLSNINFETGKARLLPVSYPDLKELVNYLQSHPNRQIEIIGHTDNIGNDAANMKLSRRRAAAVEAFLIGEGVLASRMTSTGKGELLPITTNETEEGRARNRRVEFRIY